MAMLLPASFGASRRMNDSHDIRKNLRFRNAELAQEHPEGANNEWEFYSMTDENKHNRLSMRLWKHIQSKWRYKRAIWLIDIFDALYSYCVTFEMTKVSKACHKEKVFNALHESINISSYYHWI